MMEKLISVIIIPVLLLSTANFASGQNVISAFQFSETTNHSMIGEHAAFLAATHSMSDHSNRLIPVFIGEKRRLFTAFWSSNDVPENDLKKLMSAGIARSPNFKDLERIFESGRKVIPLFGAFNADHTEAELRERVGWYKTVFERIGWENIECIILRDEPYLKNLTLHQMEIIIDEAKHLYKAPLAFTFTQNSINKRKLPAGLDMVIINFYPFFEKGAPAGYAQIHNYRSFKHEFDRTMRLIRQKSPGSEIAITAQVFGSGSGIPWRIPEPDTAEWYMKAISEHDDIAGLMFWGWKSNRYKGLSENPELQNAWIDAIQQWNRN